MDCNGCYMLKSRSIGVADVAFDDPAGGITELPDSIDLAHKQKVSGVWEAKVRDNMESTSRSFILSPKDDGFFISGSSKLHESTSEEASVSGKMAASQSTKDTSGNNGTSKVSRTGSGLGAAGMAGYGRAVEILDTLGCLMTTLSPDGGFISRTTKGTQISILAFEVANTILKGASVMQSLSEDSVTYFKQVVLPSEGVQNLISSDMGELMRIVANDRREELKVFSQEIVRFGNRCKNPQWHSLDRYFVKLESESVPQKQLKETATAEMQKLMALVQRFIS
ncbi:unnamed protein product [Triticum turgidum subsp. durum]|uniref:DUF3475 domain-containing protein n=1 Tax=Triticum turgidum subsp. durum TaxID=4567 RepID=A0A9R1PQX3_TRITD|nr:unnamed protein product [Triticum turgidum subsp. durum]